MSAPITWPQALPLWPLRNGFSSSMANGQHMFEPEEGEPIGRPKQSARLDVFSVTYAPLTQAQLEAFRTFHDQTLGMGSLKFAMAHPVKAVVRAAKIVSNPQEGLMRAGAIDPLWSVSFQIMMVDVPPAYASDVTLANGFVEYTGA